ncbi:hypothetical protein [Cupriavidus pauculus]|uniref:hypothetical protein n=1 Tax=Cupriavidus pauculus TaxID=82633 RepID=UPI000781E798|nr:hypothetical protein [Cupriavidus pauculus]MBY4731316.1 hypothetical protein [Cupriavidus pauculus]
MHPTPHASATTVFADLPAMVRASIKHLLSATFLGAIIALAIAETLTPKWTGRVTVQVGQITGPGQNPRLIEPALTTSERVNLPSTRVDVVKAMGLPSPESGHRESSLVFDSIRGTPSRGGDLLNLQVSAFSREQAANALQTTFALLNGVHTVQFQPSVDRMKVELANIKARLADNEREYEQTYRALKTGRDPAAKAVGAGDILASNILSMLQQRIEELTKQKEQLEDALDPVRTYPTRVLGNIYVPTRPNTPGKLLVIAAGAALGLLVGLGIAFFRYSPSGRDR